jgi:hypothetical protein
MREHGEGAGGGGRRGGAGAGVGVFSGGGGGGGGGGSNVLLKPVDDSSARWNTMHKSIDNAPLRLSSSASAPLPLLSPLPPLPPPPRLPYAAGQTARIAIVVTERSFMSYHG